MKTANLPRNGLSADYRATRRAAFAAGALSAALVSLATHALPIARAATEPPPAPLISPADCPACLDDPAAERIQAEQQAAALAAWEADPAGGIVYEPIGAEEAAR